MQSVWPIIGGELHNLPIRHAELGTGDAVCHAPNHHTHVVGLSVHRNADKIGDTNSIVIIVTLSELLLLLVHFIILDFNHRAPQNE